MIFVNRFRKFLQKMFPVPEDMRKYPTGEKKISIGEIIPCKDGNTHFPMIFPLSDKSIFHISQTIKGVLHILIHLLCDNCDQVYELKKIVNIPTKWKKTSSPLEYYSCSNASIVHDVVLLKNETGICEFLLTGLGMDLHLGLHCKRCKTTINQYVREILYPQIWEKNTDKKYSN